MSRWVAVTMLLACHASRPAPTDATRSLPTAGTSQLVPDAPQPIELFWPGLGDNPREEDHALALFTDDQWNRALPCPRASKPEGAGHRCSLTPTSTMVLASRKLWLGLSRYDWEHDGMFGFEDDIVILAPPANVIATITGQRLEVVDCGTTLTLRRAHVADIDGDGQVDLCIETVVEEGVGLFEVLDLENAHEPWTPLRRHRTIRAFSLDASTKLRKRRDLEPACPIDGYKGFVDHALGAPFDGREAMQGDAPVTTCPPPAVPKHPTCGLMDDLCP